MKKTLALGLVFLLLLSLFVGLRTPRTHAPKLEITASNSVPVIRPGSVLAQPPGSLSAGSEDRTLKSFSDLATSPRPTEPAVTASSPISPVAALFTLWPGARLVKASESLPVNGLVLRRSLIEPTNFPYHVTVEQMLTADDAAEPQRVVRVSEGVADHVLVKLQPGRTSDEVRPLAEALEAFIVPHPTAPDLYLLRFSKISLEGASQARAILSQYPELIAYAEIDAVVRAAATTPNDPRFAAEQWGLQNTAQAGGTADVDLDAPEAWDVRREATNVIVAVVDSGVRYTHEDLAQNMWRNPGEIAGNGIDDDNDGFIDDVHGINAIDDTGNPDDDVPDAVLGVGGHGTAVAGVIGAVGNNGRGIAGVAWRVQIMALKWFNNQGAGALSDAIQCLDYARQKGATIVNASWQQGGLLSGTINQSMMDALDRLKQAGVMFVSSAGNDGANNDLVAHYPSNYPYDNVVAVAAGTSAGSLSRQSNFGERLVDVVAPGEGVLSTSAKSDTEYAVVSGTSFAAPHVSGMLALLKAQFPAEDYRALINRMLQGAERKDRLVGKVRTGAFVNLFNALTAKTVTAVPEITTMKVLGREVASLEEVSVIQGTNVTLTGTALGAAPLRYSWRKDGKLLSGATEPSLTIPSFAVGDIGEYQLTVTNSAGAATLSLKLLGVVSKPEVAAAVNATNRTFLSSGNALWEGQRTISRDGLSAGASGKIVGRQATLAATTVVGPGKASFVWKVSSERNNDTLECLIDGIRVDAISGEVDWIKKEFQISAGSHEIRWRYSKDGSLSKGSDKGYLDLFVFSPDAKVAPSITAQPLNQSVLEGTTAFFAVVAEGSTPLGYQWLKDGVTIANARSNRLDLAAVTKTTEGRYSAVVSNEAGAVTSSVARLTVTPVALPPRITRQPAALTVDSGGKAQFTVAASGTPPLLYQWQKAGAALIGQTNSTLTLTNLSTTDAANYRVVVSNGAGQETSQGASLTVVQVQLAPLITKQPAGTTLKSGEKLELAVEVKGLGPFTYQWLRNGQSVPAESGSELVRNAVQTTDAGNYQVRVSSPFGVTLSAIAPVIVTLSNPPLAQTVNDTNFVWSTAGDAYWFRQTLVSRDGVDALQSGAITNLQFSQLSAQASGPGQVAFWWKVSSELGYDYLDLYIDDQWIDGISGETEWEEIIWNLEPGTHTISWVYSKDEEFAEGADAAWLDQVSFVSFDTESPVIAEHPIAQSGLVGGEATFVAEALGNPPLRFQWFKGEVPIQGATSRTLTVRNLSQMNEGNYHLTVSNRFGVAVSRDAFLYVFDESEATDFALEQPGLEWTNYIYAAWYPQVDTTLTGVSALRSGPVGDNGVAWLGSAISGPGILYYSWKVSSEEDFDWLEFLLDDQLIDYISGEVDWREGSVIIPPGIHYIDWVYLKDEAIDSGEDAGWLDDVAFVPLEGFAYWQHLYFSPADLIDTEVSGPDADPDFDGVPNQLEYAFGMDPMRADPEALPTISLELQANQPHVVIDYVRRIDTPLLSYHLESSSDLARWTVEPPNNWVEETSPWDEGLEFAVFSSTAPIPKTGSRFYRIRVAFTSPL